MTEDAKREIDEFVDELRNRLYKGAVDYGGRSFDRPSHEIAREMEEEVLDIAGWAFIVLTKLRRRMRRLMEAGSSVGLLDR